MHASSHPRARTAAAVFIPALGLLLLLAQQAARAQDEEPDNASWFYYLEDNNPTSHDCTLPPQPLNQGQGPLESTAIVTPATASWLLFVAGPDSVVILDGILARDTGEHLASLCAGPYDAESRLRDTHNLDRVDGKGAVLGYQAFALYPLAGLPEGCTLTVVMLDPPDRNASGEAGSEGCGADRLAWLPLAILVLAWGRARSRLGPPA